MKGKFLLYGVTVVIVASLMAWKAMLGEAEAASRGSGGSGWRSSGPGSSSFSSGGHK